jgi:hypothetical protein
MYLGIFAKPARFAEFEKFVIARRTVDHMLPTGIILHILKMRRSGSEFPQNHNFLAATPFRIRVRRFHGPLIFALQSIPLLFR